MKKIIDYFPFFIEKELLELRINLLKDHVDKFIISETNKTHNGDDKEFICNKIIEELNLPKEKIQVIETIVPEDDHIVPEECDYVYASEAKSNKVKNWSRERIQRDSLLKVIEDYDDDDVFILSDCDEIINPDFLPYLTYQCRNLKHNVIKVPLVLLEGRADQRLYNGDVPADWSKSLLLCTKYHLSHNGSPTKFRAEYQNPFPPVWITENNQSIQDCGWHFTWMGDENLRKYKSETSVLFGSLAPSNTLSSSASNKIFKTDQNDSLITKEYPISNLPKIIFDLPRVKNFLLPEVNSSKFLNLDDMDWGLFDTSPDHKDFVKSEIKNNIYTKFFDVEEGDIVFDIGASVGPFTVSILNNLPKEVHCFEPHKEFFKSLNKNLKDYSNIHLNCLGIGNSTENDILLDSVYDLSGLKDEKNVNSIRFKDYIEQNKIEKIDFLKIDCEGGEWSVFTEENFDWITKNIRKISGEFHLHNLEMKISFIHFRNLYLKEAKNVIAFLSNKNADVSEIDIWDDNFIFNNLEYCNISFEFPYKNIFYMNYKSKSTSWTVDNFYEDPGAVRKFALEQTYAEGGLGRGFIGRRTEQQFLFPGLKEKFEHIMGEKITAWKEHGMNGRFQVAWAGEPLVWHCDSQQWGGMLYLTPEAPYQCGTTLYAHKKTRARTYYDQGWDAAWANIPGDPHLDGTSFEPVDVLGNVYNRLVIFDASCIHSASEYFGTVMENSRLWQMFFFDTE